MRRRYRLPATIRTVRFDAAAVAVVAGLALGYLSGAGYLGGAGFLTGKPSAGGTTTISFAACGVAPVPAIGALPLSPFRGMVGDIPLSIGPVRLAHAGEPVLLRFIEVERLEDKRPIKRDGVITLPLLASAHRPPDEIRIECRYGEVAGVTYHYVGQTMALAISSA